MTLSAIALGLLSGVVGWLVAEFLGKPFRKGVDMMIEARTSLIVFSNVPARFQTSPTEPTAPPVVLELAEEDEDRLREAEKALREMGARFLAFAGTERGAVWALRLFGADLQEVGVSFLLLSNSLQVYGAQRAYSKERAEKALGIWQA